MQDKSRKVREESCFLVGMEVKCPWRWTPQPGSKLHEIEIESRVEGIG